MKPQDKSTCASVNRRPDYYPESRQEMIDGRYVPCKNVSHNDYKMRTKMRRLDMKKVSLFFVILIVSMLTCITAFAAGNATSEYWYSEGNVWKIRDGSGNMIRDSWVCDDKYNQNQDSNWYLMDSNGVMYEGVINDNGHYYLLDPNHNGTYGMMISGVPSYSYNGVQLQLETAHNGYFGEIRNTDVISSLGLTVTNVNTAGKPFLYTSQFGSAQPAASNVNSHSNNVEFNGHYYATRSGECYHYSSICAKNASEISWEEVLRRGLRPCGTCVLK